MRPPNLAHWGVAVACFIVMLQFRHQILPGVFPQPPSANPPLLGDMDRAHMTTPQLIERAQGVHAVLQQIASRIDANPNNYTPGDLDQLKAVRQQYRDDCAELAMRGVDVTRIETAPQDPAGPR